MIWTDLDKEAMRIALDEAKKAASIGETPIGAALVYQDEIIAKAGNTRETAQDPLGHAELKVIEQAAGRLGSWRLEETKLYVTLEPCMMCAGAIYQARIPELVFGAADPKGGFVLSQAKLLDIPTLNHHVSWSHGLYAAESSELLKQFFRELRTRNKQARKTLDLEQLASIDEEDESFTDLGRQS